MLLGRSVYVCLILLAGGEAISIKKFSRNPQLEMLQFALKYLRVFNI